MNFKKISYFMYVVFAMATMTVTAQASSLKPKAVDASSSTPSASWFSSPCLSTMDKKLPAAISRSTVPTEAKTANKSGTFLSRSAKVANRYLTVPKGKSAASAPVSHASTPTASTTRHIAPVTQGATTVVALKEASAKEGKESKASESKASSPCPLTREKSEEIEALKRVEDLKGAAEAGDVAACKKLNSLGELYEFGNGMPKNEKVATECYAAVDRYVAAASKNAEACSSLLDKFDENYVFGGENTKDEGPVVDRYGFAEEAILFMQEIKPNDEKDEKLAFDSSRITTCVKKVIGARAQHNLERCTLKIDAKKGVIGASKKLYELGKCYEFGRGRAVNKSIAADCYRVAAETGSVDAWNALGECYEFGRGVSRNEQLAKEVYTIAVHNGSTSVRAKAQRNLERCTVKIDVKDVRKDGDIAINCRKLMAIGMAHERGADGFEQDSCIAFDCYKVAAEAGSFEAWNKLGELYEFGKCGVCVDEGGTLMKNEPEAYRCYSEAGRYAVYGKASDAWATLIHDNLYRCMLKLDIKSKDFDKALAANNALMELGVRYEENSRLEGCRDAARNEALAADCYAAVAGSGSEISSIAAEQVTRCMKNGIGGPSIC